MSETENPIEESTAEESTAEENTAEEIQADETPTTAASTPEPSKVEEATGEASTTEEPKAGTTEVTQEPANSSSESSRNNDGPRSFAREPRDQRRGRDDRRGGRGGRFGPREDRGPVSNVYTGGPPADYVQPQYRGRRSRRVEGSININDVHYRNTPLLSKFLDPYGRIMSRRKTRVSAKVQRKAVKAIKQARHLCLLPYTGEQMRVARKRRRR